MQNETIHVFNPTNPVHQFIQRQLEQGKVLHLIRGNAKELRKYRHPSLLRVPTVLILEKLEPSRELSAMLEQLKMSRRELVLHAQTKVEFDYVRSLNFAHGTVKVYPAYKQWQEKEALCMEVLEARGLYFETGALRKLCIKLLIREIVKLQQYAEELEALYSEESPISQADIEAVFADTDIVSLPEWALGFVQGSRPIASLKELDYFLYTKLYTATWIGEYLKSFVLELGLVYDARARGIVYSPNIQDDTAKRAKVVKYAHEAQLTAIKYREFRLYLTCAMEMPYAKYVAIQRIVMRAELTTELQLIALFTSLRGRKLVEK